jgi:hypothetical protein
MTKAADDDKNKLMAIVDALAKKEHWKRKNSYYRQSLTYLFNYGKEELMLWWQGHTLHFQLKPFDAPHALKKIANAITQFFQQNPKSQMTLAVTLLNLNESRVKVALKNMLQQGIDIDKVVTLRTKGGSTLPPDKLLELIKEVKATVKPKPNKP